MSFPLNSNQAYIKDTGERSTLGAEISGGGSTGPTVPTPEEGDTGKVLTVGADGTLEWDEKGEGGGDAFFSYDFTKGGTITWGTASYTDSGAVIDSTSDYIPVMAFPTTTNDLKNTSIVIDIASLQVDDTSSSHQRFIMADSSNGFIYEKNRHVWGFYYGNWEYTETTDPDLFNGCTLKLYIDNNKYWHIYKNGTLLFDCNHAIDVSVLRIGASEQGINDAVIKSVKLYPGNYTE